MSLAIYQMLTNTLNASIFYDKCLFVTNTHNYKNVFVSYNDKTSKTIFSSNIQVSFIYDQCLIFFISKHHFWHVID